MPGRFAVSQTTVCEAPMLIGYARVSKTDGSQVLDLQRDALIDAGVALEQIYQDEASGKREDRPGLKACLKALRPGDILVVWKWGESVGFLLFGLFNVYAVWPLVTFIRKME